MSPAGAEVLVGYDGSPGSERALSWAVREACARQVPLTVCHAWGLWDGAPDGDPQPPEVAILAYARQRGEQILTRGMRRATRTTGPGSVRPLLADGRAAAVLCQRSGPETLVVTGAHGTGGGIPGLLIGSVSAQVAAYARGPVVIERGHWRPAAGYQPGPVLAGADGSTSARAVLAFAADEAILRQAPLLVVCALADAPGVLGGTGQLREDVQGQVSALTAKHPDLQIQCQFADGPPQGALLTAAREAQLIVVGCRGRRGLPRMALGSVAEALLARAPCPVGIVHEHQQSPHQR